MMGVTSTSTSSASSTTATTTIKTTEKLLDNNFCLKRDRSENFSSSECESDVDVDAFVEEVLRGDVEDFVVQSFSPSSLSLNHHPSDAVFPIKSSSLNVPQGIANDEHNAYSDASSSTTDLDNSALETLGLDEELHILGPRRFVERQIALGLSLPGGILEAFGVSLPLGLARADAMAQWSHVARYLERHVYQRPRLGLSSLEDVVDLLRNSRRILIVIGAGVSVNCGIPDFRSGNGLYSRIQEKYSLPQPECMFDIEFFRIDPEPFYSFARELLPRDEYKASFSHHFIADLERRGQLLRLYTQNIDMLERDADIKKTIYCHGSFSSASCLDCGKKMTFIEFKQALQNENLVICSHCQGFIKPDIVFFGEPLPRYFEENIERDCLEADLLLVIGSSMKVLPVSSIPGTIDIYMQVDIFLLTISLDIVPPHIPQILINKESLRDHNYDIELLGDCDVILAELFRRLDEKLPLSSSSSGLREKFGALIDNVNPNMTDYQFIQPFYHVFSGAHIENLLRGNEGEGDDDDEGDENAFFSENEKETNSMISIDELEEMPAIAGQSS